MIFSTPAFICFGSEDLNTSDIEDLYQGFSPDFTYFQKGEEREEEEEEEETIASFNIISQKRKPALFIATKSFTAADRLTKCRPNDKPIATPNGLSVELKCLENRSQSKQHKLEEIAKEYNRKPNFSAFSIGSNNALKRAIIEYNLKKF